MGKKLIANTKERIGRGICGSPKFRDREGQTGNSQGREESKVGGDA